MRRDKTNTLGHDVADMDIVLFDNLFIKQQNKQREELMNTFKINCMYIKYIYIYPFILKDNSKI